MEIITKEGSKINRYTPSEDQQASGKWGKKVGIACELENGEIIYADYLCAGGNLPMSMFYYIFAPAQKR